MSSGGSIPFDRAAEVYDQTRGLTAEASAATTDLLRRELEARQPCLEIGVGTGLIGLPLHRGTRGAYGHHQRPEPNKGAEKNCSLCLPNASASRIHKAGPLSKVRHEVAIDRRSSQIVCV